MVTFIVMKSCWFRWTWGESST